jgi:hypothetical protein
VDHPSGLQLSEAVTEFFKDLSLQILQNFPDKVVHHLKSFSAAEQVREVQNMMTDVLHVADKQSLKTFLCTYIPKMSTNDGGQLQDDLIAYLGDTEAFHMDLNKATHLDIRDMVNALQKGVLDQLCKLVQQSRSKVLDIDDGRQYVKRQLTSYDWICQLSKVNVNQLLEGIERMGSKFDVSVVAQHDALKLLKLDASVAQSDDVLKLLRYYGVIKWNQSTESEHRVVTVKAANLSLKDILSNCELVPVIKDSDEIRFFCAEYFYIDTSIDDSKHPDEGIIWASKSVAITALKIHVKKDCSINLSGANGDNGMNVSGKKKADDGEEPTSYGPGGHGHHGEHGTPGQSGGNILICAGEIINSERLNLRSCGGNGGDGQDGGSGQDGKAKPTASDDLSDWPDDFARIYGATAHTSQQKIVRKMIDQENKYRKYIQESALANYVYCETPKGVQILFGTVDLYRYGFLLSKSKGGVSADGGNAGKGGKGGGGGQAGAIDVIKTDGRPYLYHEMTIEAKCGKDGIPGRTGKPGKRAIAQRQYDHLRVDGAGLFATTKQYDCFISVKPWERSPKTNRLMLGSGYYYCKCEVSKQLDSSIDSDYIHFFKTTKTGHLPTKHNRQAVDGKKKEQCQIIGTTKTKAISKAAINLEFQLFANQNMSLQDHSSLLQSLEQLEHMLREELQELEIVHQKTISQTNSSYKS